MTIDLANASGREIRELCRRGAFDRPTAGVALGYVQANLVVLERALAGEFEQFCRLNRGPCPLLEKTELGSAEAGGTAPGSDLRTDLPRYRVLIDGECVDRPTSIERYWNDDCIGFLIGCSFTFESALLRAGLPVRHIECGSNVPMYRTNRECIAAGPFGGKLVVSMRPMTRQQADEAARITAALPLAHGAPIQVGNAENIGIADLSRPDYGDAVPIADGEVPVFWACGVTPLEVIVRARPKLSVVHEPGHMFVTDLMEDQLADWDLRRR
jgi:uncharacterized protein YcsI (UPF0317 family)